jgi:phosphate transport system substrate-binding protein
VGDKQRRWELSGVDTGWTMMRKSHHAGRFRWLTPAAAAVLAAIAATSQCFADTIIVQGSTTFGRRVMEPHKETIESISGHEVTVIPNKSLPGLIALMEGRAHMAMISASLKSEIDALQKIIPGIAHQRLQAHDVMATPIAIAVHPSNPVRKAKLEQVRKILMGEITNWSALGGPNLPIRIVLVGGGGGVTSVVESELLGGQQAKAPNIIYTKTPIQLVQITEQERGAIGFAQLTLARQKWLPELATDRPIEQRLSLVTLGEPTPAMRAVISAARQAVEKSM